MHGESIDIHPLQLKKKRKIKFLSSTVGRPLGRVLSRPAAPEASSVLSVPMEGSPLPVQRGSIWLVEIATTLP